MKIVAGCTLEEALKYDGKLTLQSEGKKTPDKVVLNLEVGKDDKVDFSSLPKIVEIVTVNGISNMKVPSNFEGRVFNSMSFEDYRKMTDYESSLPLLVYLPNDYSDMLTLRKECDSNDYVRFYGGNLLAVEGVRIGRFEKGKEKMSPVFCGVYDNFMEAKLSELSGLVEVLSKNRKKLDVSSEPKKKGKSKKSSAPAKKSNAVKKKEAVSRLFGAGNSAF